MFYAIHAIINHTGWNWCNDLWCQQLEGGEAFPKPGLGSPWEGVRISKSCQQLFVVRMFSTPPRISRTHCCSILVLPDGMLNYRTIDSNASISRIMIISVTLHIWESHLGTCYSGQAYGIRILNISGMVHSDVVTMPSVPSNEKGRRGPRSLITISLILNFLGHFPLNSARNQKTKQN